MDSYQFSRRPRAVSATSGITFEDFDKMHVDYRVVQRERRMDTPEWTANTELLRIAVINALERRLYVNTTGTWQERLEQINAAAAMRVPEKQAVLRDLLAEYTTASPDRQRVLEKQIANLDTDLVLTARGYAAIILAVMYYFWRLGYDGTQIAEALSLKSAHVRQILNRTRRSATVPAPKFLPRTPERRAYYEKLRARNRARRNELRRREKISAALRGKKRTPEQCAARREIARRNWAAGKYSTRKIRHSPECRAKMSKDAKLRATPAWREAQSKRMKAAWAAGKFAHRKCKARTDG